MSILTKSDPILINDLELRKNITTAISKLLIKEAAEKINFAIFKNVSFFMRIFLEEKDGKIEHFIGISVEAAKMLGKDPLGIVLASLAHEIGHFADISANGLYMQEDIEELMLKAEVAADKNALQLLAKVFCNPKDILMKQIFSAIAFTEKIEYHTEDDMVWVNKIASARLEALNSY